MADMRYGLLPSREVGGESPSPTWDAARKAAFEAESFKHEVQCTAYAIARGPWAAGAMNYEWRTSDADPTHAIVVRLHPLPWHTVSHLVRTGVIDQAGVNTDAFKEACEDLWNARRIRNG